MPIATQGDHTVTYWSQDNAGNVEAAKSTHVKFDNVAPIVSLSLTAAGSAALTGSDGLLQAGRRRPSSRTFRLRATVADTTSGPASAGYPALTTSGWTHAAEPVVTTPGAGVYDSSPFTWTTSASNPAGYSLTVADQAGNTATQALTFANDQTAPTGTLTLGPSPVGALLAGTTLYSAAPSSGSFTLVDSVTDSGSGPCVGGVPGRGHVRVVARRRDRGHRHGAAPTVAYASSQYAWTAGAGNPSSTTVTSADRVGNTSDDDAPARRRQRRPTDGALRVNSVDATAAGSASTDTDGNFTIGHAHRLQRGLGRGLCDQRADPSAGDALGGTCGAFGSPTTITGAPAQSGLGDGCYRYTLTGADKLGNTASVSTTVKVVSLPDRHADVRHVRRRLPRALQRDDHEALGDDHDPGHAVRRCRPDLRVPVTSSPWSYVDDIFDLWIGLTFTARARQVDGDGNVSAWSDPITFEGF